jgi:hypothetical protein
VTRAEANTYFLDRLDASSWNAATDPAKDQALITATLLLDNQHYTGYMVVNTQALAFPRVGEYFDPRVGSVVIFESDVVPARILTANFELALHLLNNSGLLDDIGKVKNIRVGKVALDNVRDPNKIPYAVSIHVRPLYTRAGYASNWHRAN